MLLILDLMPDLFVPMYYSFYRINIYNLKKGLYCTHKTKQTNRKVKTNP